MMARRKRAKSPATTEAAAAAAAAAADEEESEATMTPRREVGGTTPFGSLRWRGTLWGVAVSCSASRVPSLTTTPPTRTQRPAQHQWRIRRLIILGYLSAAIFFVIAMCEPPLLPLLSMEEAGFYSHPQPPPPRPQQLLSRNSLSLPPPLHDPPPPPPPPPLSPSIRKGRPPRIYCIVPMIWTSSYVARYEEIRRTWGGRCDVLRFVIDPIVGDDTLGFVDLLDVLRDDGNSNSTEAVLERHGLGDKLWQGDQAGGGDIKEGSSVGGGHIAVVNMSRPWNECRDERTGERIPCRYLWEKVWRSWLWVDEHEIDEADWFFKIDTDTYFFPDNLAKVLEESCWDAEAHHYIGRVNTHLKSFGEIYASGGAYGLSRRTLRDMAYVLRFLLLRGADQPDGDGVMGEGGYGGKGGGSGGGGGGHGTNRSEGDRGWEVNGVLFCHRDAVCPEDAWTGRVLSHYLGVQAEDMVDARGRDRILAFRLGDVVRWDRNDWFKGWYWEGAAPNKPGGEECCASLPVAFHEYKGRGELDVLEGLFYGTGGGGAAVGGWLRGFGGTGDGGVVGEVLGKREGADGAVGRYVQRARRAMRMESFAGLLG